MKSCNIFTPLPTALYDYDVISLRCLRRNIAVPQLGDNSTAHRRVVDAGGVDVAVVVGMYGTIDTSPTAAEPSQLCMVPGTRSLSTTRIHTGIGTV